MRTIKRIINEILDKQEKKGIATYGHSLEDCPPEKYNWQQMTIEELIDALQYQVKRNLQLEEFIAFSEEEKFRVVMDVGFERIRQDKLWGLQRHTYGNWLKILIEEVGEIAQAMQKGNDCYKSSDADDLYKELIQTAAVAVAIAEQVKEEREKENDQY